MYAPNMRFLHERQQSETQALASDLLKDIDKKTEASS
jgi:hypothetical protein